MIIRAPRTEEDQRAFYLSFMEAALRAEAATGTICRYYRIAGTVVCLKFAGEALLPYLTPALQHLVTDAVPDPDLVLHVWDTESTGQKAPPPPCLRKDFTDRGDIWGFDSKRFRTAFHYSEYSVNLMDTQGRTGIYWVRSPRHFPYWVYSSPFRTLFHWWMQMNGRQLVHAAAIGNPEGAVLVTGRGGSGKSSTALRCLEDGWLYLGDDYVVVAKDPIPQVFSLYCTAKLSPADMQRFPGLNGLPRAGFHRRPEKETIFLLPGRKGQIVDTLPLKAILTPRVCDRRAPDLVPASYWQIHRSMSFTTMAQLPGAGHETHDYLGGLVERLPCHTLLLGSHRDCVPATVRRSLQTSLTPPQVRIDFGGKGLPPGRIGGAGDNPLITVIIPVYNGEKFIARAIENILSQDYPAIELIVVDDESTDRTAEILHAIDVDMRYFHQPNQGPAAARNRGVLNASGEIIAFLDADDYWPPNNLSLLLGELLQNPGLDLVRGHAQLVSEDEEGRTEFLGSPHESFPDYIGAGLYRKRAFARIGMYDSGLRFGEDSDWFNRAREAGLRMKKLDEVTLYVTRHGGNMTEGRDLVELNILQVFKKFLERKRANQGSSQ
jgi:hypothetical protein